MMIAAAIGPAGDSIAFLARRPPRLAIAGGVLSAAIVVLVALPLFIAVKLELRLQTALRAQRAYRAGA